MKTTLDDAMMINNNEFRIDERTMTLEPGDRIDLGFHVKFVPNLGVPLIGQIRLNGQNICTSTVSRSFTDNDRTIQSSTVLGNTIRFGISYFFILFNS